MPQKITWEKCDGVITDIHFGSDDNTGALSCPSTTPHALHCNSTTLLLLNNILVVPLTCGILKVNSKFYV